MKNRRDPLTKAERERLSYLIHTLASMGRQGWKHYTARDWKPLQDELEPLMAKTRHKLCRSRV